MKFWRKDPKKRISLRTIYERDHPVDNFVYSFISNLLNSLFFYRKSLKIILFHDVKEKSN